MQVRRCWGVEICLEDVQHFQSSEQQDDLDEIFGFVA
jgi:hypothetical protein